MAARKKEFASKISKKKSGMTPRDWTMQGTHVQHCRFSRARVQAPAMLDTNCDTDGRHFLTARPEVATLLACNDEPYSIYLADCSLIASSLLYIFIFIIGSDILKAVIH